MNFYVMFAAVGVFDVSSFRIRIQTTTTFCVHYIRLDSVLM